jgi:nucleotide-binding universal stress UspA family protein
MIAAQLGAELHLLHVLKPLELYPGFSGSLDEAAYEKAGQRASSSQLAALAGRLESRHGIKVHEAQRIGRAHSEIAAYADSIGARLVVVGARSKSSLRRILLGSVAWRLFRVRLGAVLVVRQTAIVPYRKAIAAIDFSRDSRAALTWASRLAGDVHALHVLPEENQATLHESGLDNAAIRQRSRDMYTIAGNLMSNLLEGLSLQGHSHIESGYAPEVILERAASWHNDLIVLGRHGHSGLEEYLLGSVSKDVAQEADCDVLVTGIAESAG